jgi:hypothetical protein
MERTTSPAGLNETDPDVRLRKAARLAVGAWVQVTSALSRLPDFGAASGDQRWQGFALDLIELRHAMVDLANAVSRRVMPARIKGVCTCEITAHERIERADCPVHS